jgi:hypothetical protein
MIETTVKTSATLAPSKTITIRPASLQPNLNKNQQQIIVIPQSMLVNGCISAKDLKSIIGEKNNTGNGNNNSQISQLLSPNSPPQNCVKTMENRGNLKRSSMVSSSDSCYESDSETGSDHIEIGENGEKSVRKRANLDHLSPEEKMMRRKLKNRVAAQNARDKKRCKMEEMEVELENLKAHSKQLELRNAELVSANERLTSENDLLKISENSGETIVRRGQEAVNPLVVPSSVSCCTSGLTGSQLLPGLSQPTESSELTHEPQQKEQGWLRAGGSMDSKASQLVMASKLLLNVLKANRRQMRLPPKKRSRRLWPT